MSFYNDINQAVFFRTTKLIFKECLGYIKDELVVHVTPHNSQIERRGIPRNEFEGVWNNVKKYSPETRFINKDNRLESFTNKNGSDGKSFQISYITTLVKHIVQDQEMGYEFILSQQLSFPYLVHPNAPKFKDPT